jgi:hypothetical protein
MSCFDFWLAVWSPTKEPAWHALLNFVDFYDYDSYDYFNDYYSCPYMAAEQEAN